MKKLFAAVLVVALFAALGCTLSACNEGESGCDVELLLFDPYDYSVLESGDVVQVPASGTALGVAIRDAETGRHLVTSDIPQFNDLDVVVGEEGSEVSSDVPEIAPIDCLSVKVERFKSSSSGWEYYKVAQASGNGDDGADEIMPIESWPVEEGIYKFTFTFDCYRNGESPYDDADRKWALKRVSYVLRLAEDKVNGAVLPITYDDSRDAKEVYAMVGETVPLVFNPEYTSDYTFTASGAYVEFICDGGETSNTMNTATLKVRGEAGVPLHFECKNLLGDHAVFSVMTDITPTVLNAGDELTFTMGESRNEVVELSMEKYTMLNWYVTGGDVSAHAYHDSMYPDDYGASGTDPHGYIYSGYNSRRFLAFDGDPGTEVTLRVEEPPVIEFGKEYTVRMSAEDVEDIYDTAYSVITPYSNNVRLNVAVETGAVNVERYSRGIGGSVHDPLSISVWDETCFGGKELSQYISCIPNVPSYFVLSPGRVSDFTYSVDPEAWRLNFGSNTISETASRLYYFLSGATMNYVMSWQNIDKVTLYDSDGNELPASFMGEYGETYYVVVEGAGENATLDIAYADMATYDMTSPITGVMGDDGFVCARFVAPESCKYNFIDSGIYKVACVENNYERAAWEEFDAGQEIIFKLYGTPGEEYSFELEIYYIKIKIATRQNVYEAMYSFEITDAGDYEIYAYSYVPENISITVITPEGEEIAVAATGGNLIREFVPGTYFVRVVGSGSATVEISPVETV